MKKNLNDFLKYLLKEDTALPIPQSAFEVRPVEHKKDISLDQIVDRYIIRYEKECIPTADSYENEMFESVKNYNDVLEEVLSEADEDLPGIEDAESDDAAIASDGGADDLADFGSTMDVGGGATEKIDVENKVPVVNTPQINMQEFAKSVARLVNGFDTLLNPKEVILNRVEDYIATNYDQRTAEELMQILDVNYKLKTLKTRDENEREIPTHYAAGALSTEG